MLSTRISSRRTRRPVVALLATVAVAGAMLVTSACGDSAADERPRIAVTTPMLGTLVTELVGDRARVEVLMPNGADPHEYRPSAREVAALTEADLLVENGLELETGLLSAIERAREDGVPVFTATDHIALRKTDGDHGHEGEADHEHGEEAGHDDGDEAGHDNAGDADHEHGAEAEHAGDADHEHGPDDPHIWTDPLTMRAVVEALAAPVQSATGIDTAERGSALSARLAELDRETRGQLAPLTAAQRRFVTGHESLGYFADRYRLELVGALLPSFTSQAAVSAANLAELRAEIEREKITVILAETGTPPGVADAIANQTGARVVAVNSHTLPADGSYFTFIGELAETIAGAYDAP